MKRLAIVLAVIFLCKATGNSQESKKMCDELFPEFEWFLTFPCNAKTSRPSSDQLEKHYDFFDSDGTLIEHFIVTYSRIDPAVSIQQVGLSELKRMIENDVNEALEQMFEANSLKNSRILPLKSTEEAFSFADYGVVAKAAASGRLENNLELYIYLSADYYAKFGQIIGKSFQIIATVSKVSFDYRSFRSELLSEKRIKDPYVIEAPLMGISFELPKHILHVDVVYSEKQLTIDVAGVGNLNRKEFNIAFQPIRINKIRKLQSNENFTDFIKQFDNEQYKVRLNLSEWNISPQITNILFFYSNRKQTNGPSGSVRFPNEIIFELNEHMYKIILESEYTDFEQIILKNILASLKELPSSKCIVKSEDELVELSNSIFQSMDEWINSRFLNVKGNGVEKKYLGQPFEQLFESSLKIANYHTLIVEQGSFSLDKREIVATLNTFDFDNEEEAKTNFISWANLFATLNHEFFDVKPIKTNDTEVVFALTNVKNENLKTHLEKLAFGVRVYSKIFSFGGNDNVLEVQFFMGGKP